MAKVHFYPNPDRDFVLHGGQPHFYREQPGFLSNSMLTDTSKNLSQHLYHPERYGDDPQLRGSLCRVTRGITRVNGDLRRSLLMDDDSNVRSSNISRTYTQAELNEVLRDAISINPPPKAVRERADWYTKPIHFSKKVRVPMSCDDTLATRFFPVTLGQSRTLEMLGDIRPGSDVKASQMDRSRQRSKSAKFQREGESNQTRVDDMFFLTAEAPYIKTSNIDFTSPFDDDLTRLRLEKLRLEELQYLELKRQAELERIRGPKPRWYSLKGPEFHVEANKNNELLRNSAKWDDLLRYRESLMNATKRLRTALEEYEMPA